eukprot:TRINITY_DN16985_c0_g1_i1.p1 TRINITY_DN16985_c0_g1~~TRINITY_DN16985_c0_g1_i1.p1  ORF type:complete len:490 (-),score=106.82 TRINITY_DN16985_c0_g1_i1:51-1385(-)
MFAKIFFPREVRKGYAPLCGDWEGFFTRRMFIRVRDCFNRPIFTVPGERFDVQIRRIDPRTHDVIPTGEVRSCYNLSSYNYLGFGENSGPVIDKVKASINEWGVGIPAARGDCGDTIVHRELEREVAEFVGLEDSIIYGMGFGTNSTAIPALVGAGDLVISDYNNHASIATGCMSSDANVKTFKHNDALDLERVVRNAIVSGQPRTHRPWTRILIIIEGIYSMEGEMCDLPAILEVKEKYGCYLFIDEAHSIGALGPSGRGVCDFFQIDPKRVDILMGTFTKSFGSVGGYIASSKLVIDKVRLASPGHLCSEPLAPACVVQALEAFRVITGADGTTDGVRRITKLRENSNYFRQRLMDMGFHVFCDKDSPVVLAMLFNPSKVAAFSRMCLERGVAIVVVGYPATPVILSRVRFCLSSSHTREGLDEALAVIEDVGRKCALFYCK